MKLDNLCDIDDMEHDDIFTDKSSSLQHSQKGYEI